MRYRKPCRNRNVKTREREFKEVGKYQVIIINSDGKLRTEIEHIK